MPDAATMLTVAHFCDFKCGPFIDGMKMYQKLSQRV